MTEILELEERKGEHMSKMRPTEEKVEKKGYVSERGPFELNENPEIAQPIQPEEVDPKTVDFEYGGGYEALAEKYGRDVVRDKIIEMEEVINPGLSGTVVFRQEGPGGMSIVHMWFGPHFPLFRHSHPLLGDCLYYVTAGEIIYGKRRLRAGSTIFLPNGMPYKYTAGPVGAELLEIRPGLGDKGTPYLQLHDTTLDGLQESIDLGRKHGHQWQVPEQIGDTALRQAEYDAAHPEQVPRNEEAAE